MFRGDSAPFGKEKDFGNENSQYKSDILAFKFDLNNAEDMKKDFCDKVHDTKRFKASLIVCLDSDTLIFGRGELGKRIRKIVLPKIDHYRIKGNSKVAFYNPGLVPFLANSIGLTLRLF